MNSESIHARRWWILGVLVISLLVVVLDNTILNVALPTIEQDLNASQSQQEWFINSYTLVFAALLFTYGVLGDRYGRRLILLIGLALFGLASALSAFSGSAGQLIGSRALMGIGGAAVLPSTLSIISNVFEPAERGKAIGIWAGFTGLAVAVGPIVGGALLDGGFWWGSVFLINVPVVLVGLVLIVVLVPESRDPHPKKVDPLGVLLSVAGLVLLVYGIVKGGQTTEWLSAPVLGSILGGLAIIAAFVWFERRSDHPSLDIELFRNPAFTAASLAITSAFFALFGATFFLTYYLQFDRGYTPLEAGIRLLPVAVAIAFFAPRSAKLAKRYGARIVCTVGLLLVTIAFLMYQLIDSTTSIWVLELLLFIQGAGMANTMAPATESIMSTLPREQAGAGSAVNNTVRQVGGALGVAILGSVLSAAYRSRITDTLSGLPIPAAAKRAAGESLGATLGVLRQAGGQLDAVVPKAHEAFVSAMHITALGSALVSLLGAAVVWRYLPASQSRVEPAAAHGAAEELAPSPAR